MRSDTFHIRLLQFAAIAFLITTLTGGAFSGCIRESGSSSFKTYTDNIQGYSFSYPGNWEQVESGMLQSGEYVAFLDFKKVNGMPPYVSVSEVPLKAGTTLDDYFKSEMNNAANDESYTFISKDNIEINGIPAIRHVASYDHATTPAKVMQVIMLYDNSVWIVNCMCSPGKYNTYEPIFKRIIDSFKFSGVSAAAQAKQSAYPDMQTYRDSVNNFSISYPRGWEEMPHTLISGLLNVFAGEGMVAAGFWSPDKIEYGFTPNFIIARVTSPYEQDLESAYEEIKTEAEQKKGYAFVSKDYRTINGIPAIKFVYRSSDIANSTQMYIILMEGKVGWIILFSCAPQSFNSLEPTFDAIGSSLQTK